MIIRMGSGGAPAYAIVHNGVRSRELMMQQQSQLSHGEYQ
jgi:hypothetical protein